MASKKQKVLEVLKEQVADSFPLGFKVSKITIHPSRKINLGNFESVDCSAGMEIVFDQPVEISSPLITDAATKVHERLQKIFGEQKIMFGKNKKKEGDDNAEKK